MESIEAEVSLRNDISQVQGSGQFFNFGRVAFNKESEK